MKIQEIKPAAPVPFLRVQIMSMKPILDTENGQLREATVEDDTGHVILTLWRDQCHQFQEGDILIIEGGWAKEYPTGSGNINLSSGKRGSIKKDE